MEEHVSQRKDETAKTAESRRRSEKTTVSEKKKNSIGSCTNPEIFLTLSLLNIPHDHLFVCSQWCCVATTCGQHEEVQRDPRHNECLQNSRALFSLSWVCSFVRCTTDVTVASCVFSGVIVIVDPSPKKGLQHG